MITSIDPETVWKYFREISRIPRCSGHEEKIREYIIAAAKESGLEYRQDKAGNLAVRKKACGAEPGTPALILQAHLDMVCVKNANSSHDFGKDALDLYTDGDWLKARDTSLGADNGIGAAMILAVLFSDKCVHGPLTALFTVEEETGLIGASALDKDLAGGDILINLDTEEEGELYIGCAGGKITEGVINLEYLDCPAGYSGIFIETNGLHGGHSGLEIGKGYANAIHCSLEIASLLHESCGFLLSEIKAPGKHNAIPVVCTINGVIPDQKEKEAYAAAHNLAADIRNDFRDLEGGMVIKTESCDTPARVITPEMSELIIRALSALPHGVIETRRDVEGLVNTSVNFATAEKKNKSLTVTCSQRSFVRHSRDFTAERMMNILKLAGFSTRCTIEYPPWTPDPESALLELCKEIWKEQSGRDALVKAVHAGLECGILTERLGKMQMISIGPDMKEVHTVNERLSVSSTNRVWDYLQEILRRLAKLPELY